MYNTMKWLIKYKIKTKEDLFKYANAYLKANQLTKEEHEEIVGLINGMEQV